MAWRVQIENNDRVQTPSGWQLHLTCRYYDDADPANTPTPTNFLWTKDFYFNGSTLTLQIVQDAVFAEGALQRTAYNNAGTGASLPALQPGLTYQVP